MSTALVLRLTLAFAPMPTPAPAAPPAPPPPAIEPRLLATIPDILRDDRIEMPDDRNAFVVWLDAASRFQDLPLDLESVAHGLATSRDATATLDRADRVALSAWLGANGQALRTFVDGIAMDRAQVPRAASINEPQTYLGPFRQMIRALLVRARIQLDVGSADRALADVMSVLRFAHMFEAAGGRPIEFALGLGVRAEALRIIESIFADAAPMSERSLARLLASLRQNDPRAVDAAHAWAVEYHVAFLTQLERLARRATPATMARELDEATDPARLSDAAWRPIAESLLLDRTLVDVPEIFHLGTDVHARLALAQLDAAPEPDPSLLAEIDRIRDVAGTHVAMAHLQWDLAAGRFAAGEVVTGAGMESIDGVAGWMFIAAALPHVSTSALVNARSEHRLLTVLVAIELFRHRQGRLPSTVGEVVSSGLLTEVPVDPWTGGAFVYRPDAGVVYSFGRDGVDGGGDASTDRVLHLTPSGIVR